MDIFQPYSQAHQNNYRKKSAIQSDQKCAVETKIWKNMKIIEHKHLYLRLGEKIKW